MQPLRGAAARSRLCAPAGRGGACAEIAGKSNSRFPAGMTTRKATATAKATATRKATATAKTTATAKATATADSLRE